MYWKCKKIAMPLALCSLLFKDVKFSKFPDAMILLYVVQVFNPVNSCVCKILNISLQSVPEIMSSGVPVKGKLIQMWLFSGGCRSDQSF